MSESTPLSVPATPKAAEPTPAVPTPPAPTPPRLLDSPGHKTPMRPAVGAVVNVGDFAARLGDGSACPAASWPRTNDPAADRRAFAAAFVGCSAGYADPARVPHGGGVPGPIDVQTGGNWLAMIRGPVTNDDPLGPAIAGGALSPTVLEKCEKDQAVATAVAVEGAGWRVKLLGPK